MYMCVWMWMLSLFLQYVGQSRKSGNTDQTRRRKTKQRHNTVHVGHNYVETNTKYILLGVSLSLQCSMSLTRTFLKQKPQWLNELFYEIFLNLFINMSEKTVCFNSNFWDTLKKTLKNCWRNILVNIISVKYCDDGLTYHRDTRRTT